MNYKEMSVLVVDDEVVIVEQIVFFLREIGYNVFGESNPHKALECIKNRKYDIVLTDLKMPNISGIEIVKCVRELYDDTQIIIFTGYATVESAIEAIQYDVYDYIRKPFRMKEIEVAVNSAAEKLYLKRENNALNSKIQKMLSYITTLYDISSILYQVVDFNATLDMILDTLVECLKVEKVGILLCNNSEGIYKVSRFRGLNKKFASQFEIKMKDKINNVSILEGKPTVITNLSSGIYINGNYIENSENIECCVIIPIKYLDSIQGLIGVFGISEEIFSLEDEIKLLEILSVQIAPIFKSAGSVNGYLYKKPYPAEEILVNIINDKIKSAEKMGIAIKFVLARLVINNLNYYRLSPCKDVRVSFFKIVQDKFGVNAEILWKSFDSVVLVLPSGESVIGDLYVENLKKSVEGLYTNGEDKPVLSLKCSTVTYPGDSKSASEIIDRLCDGLLVEGSDICYT